MPRIARLALALYLALLLGLNAAAEDEPKLVKINDSIFMAPTSGN